MAPGFFATPQDAVAALIAALQADDTAKLSVILGPGSEQLINSGDATADHEGRARFSRRISRSTRSDRMDPTDDAVIGGNDYPSPLPIVRTGGQWHFDSHLGAQE